MAKRAGRGMEADKIRLRLNRLLKQHTRAEIARKTGTSSVNVGRYARGTQIPAAFCAELVRKFGVNATWLLLGEGAQDFSGVHPDSAREKDILNLVESLNAVNRLQIGVLTGDDHSRLLRDISEALATRDRLQQRLSEHSRTLLGRILDEIDARISKQDFNKAADLRQLAAQVSRLCMDPALETRLWEAEARVEFLQGREDNAIDLYTRVLHHAIGRGEFLTREVCTKISNFCYVLTQAGRSAEALRITVATDALADAELRNSREWAAFQGSRAQYLIDAGRLRDALDTLNRWIPHVEGFRRKFLTTMLQAALMLGGSLSLRDAMAVPPRIHSKGLWMVMLSLVQQSPELLRISAEYLIAVEDENGVNRTDWSARALQFADLIEGKKGTGASQLLRDLKAEAAKSPRNIANRAAYEALLTMYARYASGRSAALKQLRETHRSFGMTEFGNIETWVQALHARNALQLVPAGHKTDAPIRAWAEGYFARSIEAGYGMFRAFTSGQAQPAGLSKG